MTDIWTTLFFEPMYNALVFLVDILPFSSLALAIIILTILVRLLLAPLSKKTIVTQIKQKEIQPQIDDLKEKIKDPKKQSEAIMALYKKNKVNPFSSFFLLLIQLPIIIALYHVFKLGIIEPSNALYSFIHFPETISSTFLWIIDLGEKSIWLALFAGITQYIQIKLSPAFQQSKDAKAKTDQEKMAQSIQSKMMFSMPIMIVVFSYMFPSAIALYWSVSNLYTLVQEIFIRKRYEKKNGIPNGTETIDTKANH